MEHETDSIIEDNELLAEHAIKNEVRQLLSKYKHGNDIHQHGKQQKNEPYKDVLKLTFTQILDLRSE